MPSPPPRRGAAFASFVALLLLAVPGAASADVLADADSLLGAGDPAAALPLLERELGRREAADGPDAVSAAEVLERINLCHVQQGDLEAALRITERFVAIYDAALPEGDPVRARAWQELGVRCYWLEDFAGAAEATARALALHRANDPPDPEALVWCEADLAEMRRMLGDYDAAERHLAAAVDRARRELPPDRLRAVLINNLGVLLWDQDRLDEAELLYRESLALSERFAEEDPMRLATAHMNLGTLLRTQRRWDESERHLLRSLEIARGALPERDPELVAFLKEPALLYSLSGRFERALPLREEAIALLDGAKTPQNVLRAELLHEAGLDHEGRGDLEAARDALTRSLELRRDVFGPDHAIVGVTLGDLARVEGALSGHGSEAAGRAIAEALAILGPTTAAPEAHARVLAERALREHALGDPVTACATMERALDELERLRTRWGPNEQARVRFVADRLDLNDRLIEWLVDAGRGEEAMVRAERMRARVLAEQLAAAGKDLRRGIAAGELAPLEEQERSAVVRISQARADLQAAATDLTVPDEEKLPRVAELQAGLEGALRDLEAAQDGIRLRSPAWREIQRLTAEPMTAERIRRDVLQQGEALLLYRIGTRRSFAFAMAPGAAEPVVAELFAGEGADADGRRPLNAAELERMLRAPGGPVDLRAPVTPARGVAGVRELSGTGTPPADALPASASRPSALRALALALLPDAVRTAVMDADAVILVPDGMLHALPFEALETGDEAAPYWLDRGPVIRYAHSLSTLTGAARRIPRSDRIVTVCDPEFGAAPESGVPLPRLPGTRRESAAIAEVFPPARVTQLTGAEATEASVRSAATDCRFLHLATHGLLPASGDDRLAALAFTPGASGASDDDGFLHLFEIYSLHLPCELAVLSACDTNAGRIVEGEGVFALSRGFHVAGALNVVASLWPLEDEAAAEILGSFFREVRRRQEAGESIDFARILRDAKRDVRSRGNRSGPHYWAPLLVSVIR